ncbi:MAG: phosphoenolpyruvate carboxykinase [bacterium]|nr:phosphoenolpyruvate carboxykinase [bacterium]
MAVKRFEKEGRQLILHIEGEVCASIQELLQSDVFEQVVSRFCEVLREHDSPLLEPVLPLYTQDKGWNAVVELLRALAKHPIEKAVTLVSNAQNLVQAHHRGTLHDFVEALYDYWRTFNRYMVLHSQPGPSSFDRRPYRSFNATIEAVTHLVRGAYRDICENITGDHPRVYRQVSAGCNVALIAVPVKARIPRDYADSLGGVPFIRHVWIAPPMVLDPPMNKRTGQFQKAGSNPLAGLALDKDKWLCYPANVGPLVIFIYFHQRFIGLGCSLANLFETATDEQIAAGPHAIYLYGVPPESLAHFGSLPTVFYDDEKNHLLVAAVPGEDRFGYFGYLKKMTLTLHNIVMMKRGYMPYHGAMVHISLKDGSSASVLIIGDTATGKSESLEAFRVLGREHIRELRIIADDMGSLEVKEDGRLVGYGTEIGAFIRLDDLQQGYAFDQIDRAIIMSPQKVNARVVLPVTTLKEVLRGYPVDFLLYANNCEGVDENQPALEQILDPEYALGVFRQGAALARGTTTSIGLVHSYFANIFGPPQYRELHEELAAKVFHAAYNTGVFVGQLRTRLGIPGYETSGPQEAAKALLSAISARKQQR